jgi:hypothetical protein
MFVSAPDMPSTPSYGLYRISRSIALATIINVCIPLCSPLCPMHTLCNIPTEMNANQSTQNRPSKYYQGAGNCVSPRIMAVPTFRGHETIFSKNSAACLIMGKSPSKEMSTTHHQAQNHEMGHAMKTRSRSQRML